jgi:hypothetical protein
MSDDCVRCQICGKVLGNINYLHLRTHNITFEDYLKKFPYAETCAKNIKKERNKKLLGRKITWADKISKSNKESWADNPEQGRTGISLSEESKKKLSEKLKGHFVSEETRKKIGEAGVGREPWNKGLDKNSDNRLKMVSQKISDWNKEFMTDEKKLQISNTLKNRYMNGMSIPNAKNGMRKDLNMSFRSTWEANYARVLKKNGQEIIYEKDRFPLRDDKGNMLCVYIPDFKIGDKEYIEIKGHARSSDNWECNCQRCQRDKRKMKMMKEQYVDIKVSIIGKDEYIGFCKENIGKIENWETSSYDPV